MLKYRRYELATYPSADFPNDLSCFKLVEAIMDPASLQKDHLLIRLQYVSIDPLLRVWISGAKSYLDPVIPGQLIPGFALGIVLYTQSSKF